MTGDTTRAAREAVQTRQAPEAQMTAVARMWHGQRGRRHGQTRKAAWMDEDSSTDEDGGMNEGGDTDERGSTDNEEGSTDR